MSDGITEIKEIRMSPAAFDNFVRETLGAPNADVSVRTDEGVLKEVVIRWEVKK